jgi:sugar lactone lactonase YvrE
VIAADGRKTAVGPLLTPTALPSHAIALDADGNAHVAIVSQDASSGRPTGGFILRITPAGATSTVASWPAGSPGAMAPAFLALGPDGAFHFIDMVSGAIVRWTAAGGVQALDAGLGRGTAARSERALLVDAAGRVHLVFPTSVARVQEGRLVVVSDARFRSLQGAAVDRDGTLYLGDGEVVHRLTPEGVASTVVGQRGRIGFQAGELPGTLNFVTELAIGDDGVLHVANGRNIARVRVR